MNMAQVTLHLKKMAEEGTLSGLSRTSIYTPARKMAFNRGLTLAEFIFQATGQEYKPDSFRGASPKSLRAKLPPERLKNEMSVRTSAQIGEKFGVTGAAVRQLVKFYKSKGLWDREEPEEVENENL